MYDHDRRTSASIFDIKPANEWIASSREKPTPRFLFGEFWLEGELSILFADTGKGKSILAVQIAESIARGRAIEPMKLTSEPRKVLYIDFELSDKQFEMRYARDISDDTAALAGHYEFSLNLLRAEVKTNVSGCGVGFEDELIVQIERAVERTGARVVIIDNITYLRSGSVRTGEAITLMKRLKEIKTELGLSILVLAHTPKRNTTWPLNVNDLQGSKVLANFADNIFAIGQSRYDTSHRYIKHIKPRSTEMLYDAQHVPSFQLGKRDGNFLSFSFIGWRPEAVHLSVKYDTYRLDRADAMKRLAETGLSQRQIAERCETSAASVNRFLQMWSPYDDEKERRRIEEEKWREETRLADLERRRQARRLKKERLQQKERRKYEVKPARRRVDQKQMPTVEPKPDPKLISPEGKPLSLVFNDYGKETYVEEFQDHDGKPRVWYNYDNKGRRHRWERGFHGIIGRRADQPAIGVFAASPSAI